MVVPFGFSVGDCIAVSLLIKDAVLALDSAHGAAAEYQEIIRELWALDRALLERAFGWGIGFEAAPGSVRLTYADQWIRTWEMIALALLWLAVLWITRRPVVR